MHGTEARASWHAIVQSTRSLLMQLGCLTTVAALGQKNLTMVIMDNGLYQITGSQPTPAGRASTTSSP